MPLVKALSFFLLFGGSFYKPQYNTVLNSYLATDSASHGIVKLKNTHNMTACKDTVAHS